MPADPDTADRPTLADEADALYRRFFDELERYTGIELYLSDDPAVSREIFTDQHVGLTLLMDDRDHPVIILRPDLPPGLNLDILLHEVGHAYCHAVHPDRAVPPEQAETEAAAFAAIIMGKFGLGLPGHTDELEVWAGTFTPYPDTLAHVYAAVGRFWETYGQYVSGQTPYPTPPATPSLYLTYRQRTWKRWLLYRYYHTHLESKTTYRLIDWQASVEDDTPDSIKDPISHIALPECLPLLVEQIGRKMLEARNHQHGITQTRRHLSVEVDAFTSLILFWCGVDDAVRERYRHLWKQLDRSGELPTPSAGDLARDFWLAFAGDANTTVDLRIASGDRPNRDWLAGLICAQMVEPQPAIEPRFRRLLVGLPETRMWQELIHGENTPDWRFDPGSFDDDELVSIPDEVKGSAMLEAVLAGLWYAGLYRPWAADRLHPRRSRRDQAQIRLEAHAFVALVLHRYGIADSRHDADLAEWGQTARRHRDTLERVNRDAEVFWAEYGKRFAN